MSIATVPVAASSPNAAALLAGRVLLALLFLVSGLRILAGGPAGFGGYLGSLGFPAPVLVAWLVVALKIVGSILVIAGFQTRLAAIALAVFTVAAAAVGHNNFADQMEFTIFLKDLAIAGGFLILAAVGPGALSVDARR